MSAAIVISLVVSGLLAIYLGYALLRGENL